MSCTSFIETFGLKLFQRFSHLWCKEVGCKYVSRHHKQQPKLSNSSWKSTIQDPALRSSYISNVSIKEVDPIIEKVKDSKETVKKVQRQSKRNQGLNENLIIKVAELEKLFAQHKLRVLEHQAPSLTYKKQVTDPTKMSSILATDRVLNSRGKLYDSYIKKREARLTELWDLNKATMKSMHDNLAKLSWPISKHDSVSVSRHRAERLRLFLKNQKIKDDEGNVSRHLDPKPFVKKRLVKNFSTPKVCNVPNLSYMRKNSMKAYSAARKIAA